MKKIRLLFLSLVLLALAQSSFAQISSKITQIATVKNNSGWVEFKSNLTIDPATIFTTQKESFGLTTADMMKVYRSESDKIGFTHYRYQQFYQGIPIEGAEYLIHSIGNKSISGNGNILLGITKDVSPAISAQSAISKAINYVNATKYMWEIPANEQFIKMAKKDASASYYPKATLVLIDKKFGKNAANYVLAYKVDVYAASPVSYRNIYVNATTGEIYHTINLLRDTDVPGTATTKYSGVQPITTDSTAPGAYRLREADRCGIETYNMLAGTDYGVAVDFTDTDNNWQNVNAQQDEVATDAHFGAEKTYDYYLEKFGRQSYDNLNSPLYSYVHYDVGYANAYWDGQRMTYGDGDGTTNGPLTSLDVCGHEITHGVTEHSCNLVYQDEPGGLNEAFSDIFGAAIEFYASPATGDWYVGEDFDLTGGHGFRNMSNPAEFQQPDTYLGTYWYVGVMDNGGVHTNSGVANFWFYLLSDGGSGTNDIGSVYTIAGIGIDKASQIAYRALTNYMTSTSNYVDTRVATLQAAIDFYGACSNEAIQTANAWFAVGVGQAVADNDVYIAAVLSPKTDCGMTSELVRVRMIYNGCNTPINAGEKIHFYYKADGGATVIDSLTLVANLNGGDTIDFSFATHADVHLLGNHTIDCWVKYANDTVASNDTLATYTFVNKLYQNSDVGVSAIVAPVSECHMANVENVTVAVKFFGCEFLAAGSKIPLAYTINGGAAVIDTLITPYDMTPDSVFLHTFSTTANLSNVGTYTLTAQTNFAIDSNNTNDALNGYHVKNPFALRDTIITFEEANTANNFLVTTGLYAHALVSTAAHNTGAKGFLMTGGNVIAYMAQLEFPDGNNNWTINEFLSAKIKFCVDATSWTSATMRFDLKQTYGQVAYEMYLGAGNDYTQASNCRVLVNDVIPVSPTYNPTTGNTDPFETKFISLDAYAGTKFTVTIETRNISKDTNYIVTLVMDNAYIDNVKFMKNSDIGIDESNLNDNIKVYPNPVTDQLNVNFFANAAQQINVEVLDLQGKMIQQRQSDAAIGQNHYKFDMSNAPSGIYFIRITTDKGVYNNKVVKQ